MTRTVVIVESPAKCKKIESFLGPGYVCIASFGHIRELRGLNSIDFMNNFTPTFHISESKERQIIKLQKTITQCDNVILATDDDREGEAIAWHLCQQFDLPVERTPRIIFHEITKTAIQSAISNPGIINMNTVNAQLARQILDLIVGYKLSPILWNHISRNSKTGLSAGRCQTPALRLIYENQQIINKSPGTLVYNTTGYFTKKTLPYVLNHNYNSKEEMEEFLEESVNFDHKLTCMNPRTTTKKPPAPFTTSTIQQVASNELHFSPDDTMKICQTLYEQGLITYMRTDSKVYSKDFVDTAKTHITNRWGEDYIHENIERVILGDASNSNDENKSSKAKGKSKAKSKSKGKKKDEVKTQDAHEAIRPTNVNLIEIPDDRDMHPREKRMYKLIWRNTVESCMADAKYSSLTSKITAPYGHTYKYSTEQVIFPGWKIVGGYEETNDIYAYLNLIFANNNDDNLDVNYHKICCKSTMKDLKMHYTEAKLVQMLEQRGIGRPSTFSSLVKKIQDRGYVKKENVKGQKIECIDFELTDNEIEEFPLEREFGNERNKLVIQPLGVLVIEFLLEHFDGMFQYEYTKNMEDSLDVIANGQMVWHNLCQDCLEQIVSLSEGLVREKRETISIDDNHTYMIGKYGPVIKKQIGDKTSFIAVKEDIDIERLKNGEYTLEELKKESNERILGNYENLQLIIKKGKYGYYLQWGDNRKSLSGLDKDILEIDLTCAINHIKTATTGNILRVINDDISIRKSKHGNYIFYKTKRMKKPKFLKLTGFMSNYLECNKETVVDWIKETYFT